MNMSTENYFANFISSNGNIFTPAGEYDYGVSGNALVKRLNISELLTSNDIKWFNYTPGESFTKTDSRILTKLRESIEQLHPDADFKIYEDKSRTTRLVLQIMDYGMFPINGKVQRLLHQILASRHGYLALQLLDMVDNNRKELGRPFLFSNDHAELAREYIYR